MSKRIPAKYKAQLAELLAAWYRKLGGKTTPRRPYHEDDDGATDGTNSGSSGLQMLQAHPFFNDLPIGASSDLSSTIIEDQRIQEQLEQRAEELTLELKNNLTFKLQQKYQARYQYNQQLRPTPL